jgi:hypothetical protein
MIQYFVSCYCCLDGLGHHFPACSCVLVPSVLRAHLLGIASTYGCGTTSASGCPTDFASLYVGTNFIITYYASDPGSVGPFFGGPGWYSGFNSYMPPNLNSSPPPTCEPTDQFLIRMLCQQTGVDGMGNPIYSFFLAILRTGTTDSGQATAVDCLPAIFEIDFASIGMDFTCGDGSAVGNWKVTF